MKNVPTSASFLQLGLGSRLPLEARAYCLRLNLKYPRMLTELADGCQLKAPSGLTLPCKRPSSAHAHDERTALESLHTRVRTEDPSRCHPSSVKIWVEDLIQPHP